MEMRKRDLSIKTNDENIYFHHCRSSASIIEPIERFIIFVKREREMSCKPSCELCV